MNVHPRTGALALSRARLGPPFIAAVRGRGGGAGGEGGAAAQAAQADRAVGGRYPPAWVPAAGTAASSARGCGRSAAEPIGRTTTTGVCSSSLPAGVCPPPPGHPLRATPPH